MSVSFRGTSRLAAALGLTLAVAAVLPGRAAAQSPLTFTLMGGTTSSGPGDDFTESFVTRGYNHNNACPTWPCVDKGEMTETGFGASGYPFLLDLRYAILPWLGVGGQFAKTEIGVTKGTRGSNFLRLRYETDVIAPTVWASWRGLVRVGAGYARYTARVTREDYGRASEDFSEDIWGPLLEGAVTVSVLPQVALEARFQHRPVGEVSYGPYTQSEFNDTEIYGPAQADFTHWFAGIGMVINVTR